MLFIFANSLSRAQKVDWQGHRGARGLLPENSIPAFKKALELGVSTLELDVVISKDKKVVVSHEPWFSPAICLTPDKNPIQPENARKHNIYEMDYARIRQYDCGSLGNPRFPQQEKREVHKPLLADIFRMAEKYSKDHMRNEIYYNIEIKSNEEWDGIFHPPYTEFCDIVHETIDAYVPWRRVNIQSFDLRVLKYYDDKYPDVKLAVLVESENNPEKIIEALGFVPEIYSPWYELLKPKRVKWLHEKDMKVIPWTVNEPAIMSDLIKMGVDGIITDYPDRMNAVNVE